MQALPDASDKLIELGANLESIMKNQEQLLDLRDKVADMETTMAESVLKVNQAAEKAESNSGQRAIVRKLLGTNPMDPSTI
ncbi:MAG: hypothetical protein EBY62_07965 [Cellvibrionales bacterium]|nr:hypothetical protein [Cellvibrionales bacterium]